MTFFSNGSLGIGITLFLVLHNKRLFAQIAVLTLGLILGFFYCNHPQTMLPQFYGAYYSGAQQLKTSSLSDYLLHPNTRFQVDPKQVHKYAKLGSPVRPTSGETLTYKHNNISFAWIVLLADSLPGKASIPVKVEWVLLFFHGILSILLLRHLDVKRSWLFLFLYALNPLVLYFVLYPYYYFGLVLPGAMLVFLLHKKRWNFVDIFFGFLVLGWAINLRSTGILLAGFVLFLFFKKTGLVKGLLAGASLIVGFYLTWSPSQKHPIFSAYLGLAAYDSQLVPSMDDDVALDVFRNESGLSMNSGDLTGSYYQDGPQNQMNEFLTERYGQLVRDNPGLVLRNFGLNVVNSFGIGYLNDYGFLPRLIAFLIGLFTILVFLWHKKYRILFSVALLSLPVILYYPPTQIYIFGNFILLAYAWSDILAKAKFSKTD